MSLIGLFFSMLTGATLAGFYMLNKKAAPLGKPMMVIFCIFAGHLPVFILWMIISQTAYMTPEYFLPGLGVVLLTVAGNMLTIRALSLSPFSLIVPVLGLSPVFTSLIGIPLLHEWPSLLQWCGIVMVVIGILWLYAPPEEPWNVFAFLPRFASERGARPMAGAALCWAMCAPMDKLALSHASAQFHGLFVFTGTVLAFTFLLLRLGAPERAPIPRAHWLLIIITGAVGGLSYVMQLTALQHAAAGPFEAIKRVTSQLLALGFGRFHFDEKITAPKLIGIVILSCGVPLIVL
jgi:drug/metabolite transporter (DMT)-like permease